MQVSKPQESGGNYAPKEIYLGKCLYNVVAVNPNKEELKALNLYVPAEEPVYTFKQDVNGVQKDAVSVVIYLKKTSDFSVIDRVTYNLVNDHQLSSTGKFAVINKYGNDAWLEEEFINSGTMPANMSWYLAEGVKKALRGEKELIAFIRALSNFKNITSKSTEEERAGYVSIFEQKDLDKLLSGDVSDLKSVILSDPTLGVGFLLGAKTNDEGKVYQDLYKEYPLRKYMVSNEGSDEYIIKDLRSAQEAGKYSKTYFDMSSLAIKKYDPDLALAETPSIFGEDQDNEPLF